MTKEAFIDEVVTIGYEWAEYEHEGAAGIIISKNDNLIFTTYKGIETQDWNILKAGIPNLIHMTRIVGYYAQVGNWNKSKLGELKDRQQGNYTV